MKRLVIAAAVMAALYLIAMLAVRNTLHPDTWGFCRVCIIIVSGIAGYGIYKEGAINE